ncbi:MAG: hypothetical protein RL536_413, partial [Candidatus Parcubacteria bacterium]
IAAGRKLRTCVQDHECFPALSHNDTFSRGTNLIAYNAYKERYFDPRHLFLLIPE